MNCKVQWAPFPGLIKRMLNKEAAVIDLTGCHIIEIVQENEKRE